MADRRFATVKGYEQVAVSPVRKTSLSAGYDLATATDVKLPPGSVVLVPTGLKAYLPPGEVLLVAIRSSLAVKRTVIMPNGTGVIDADYVDNPDNEGHIMVPLLNLSQHPVSIKRGERIAQGIFMPYLTASDDTASGNRTGGFGSTGTAT